MLCNALAKHVCDATHATDVERNVRIEESSCDKNEHESPLSDV